MGIGSGIAEFAADFLGRASSLRDGIAVGCMVIVACCLLIDFFVESGDRKERGADPGESDLGMEDGNGDPAPYEELQKLTPVKLVVLERDFLVPKACLRRWRRIRAALVGAVVCISLLAVVYVASWWWVAAASALYLVVAVGTVWSPRLHQGKADHRRRAPWKSLGEG